MRIAELKSVRALVKIILERDVMARNSDSYLYMKVLEQISDAGKINLLGIPVAVFLECMDKLGAPSFETVRRSRQFIQAKHPELSANKAVSECRAEHERVYRDFARG